jgi:hypothetical protein
MPLSDGRRGIQLGGAEVESSSSDVRQFVWALDLLDRSLELSADETTGVRTNRFHRSAARTQDSDADRIEKPHTRIADRAVHDEAESVPGRAVEEPVFEQLRHRGTALGRLVVGAQRLGFEDDSDAVRRGSSEVEGAVDFLDLAPP